MKNQIDIKRIRDRFYVIYDYIVRNQGPNIFFEEMKNQMEEAFTRSDQKYLKRVNKEIDIWLVEMFLPNEKEELSKLLKEKLYEEVGLADLNRIKKINSILKRGKINNLNEYSLLQQRVEEIYDDDTKKVEVEGLNKLLSNFHK